MALKMFSILVAIIVGFYGSEGCPGKPVDILIMLDGTNHMTPELNNLQNTIMTRIIASLPGPSYVSVVSVGETSSDIVLYKQKDDSSIKKSLKAIDHPSALGKVISGQFIQKQIPTYFTLKEPPLINDRASIVMLMTSNNVDGFGVDVVESLRKRKTFVIGLGTKDLQDNLKEIAANEGHVGFVLEPDDIEELVNDFNDLICTDSSYLCDTDHFNIRNINQCRHCSERCSSTIQSKSASCNKYCPYYQAAIPYQRDAPAMDDGNRNYPPSDRPAQIPNASNGIAKRIGGGIAGVIGALVLLVLFGTSYRRNWFCFNSGAGRRRRQTQHDSQAVQVQEQEGLQQIHVDRTATQEAKVVDEGLIALEQVLKHGAVHDTPIVDLAAENRLSHGNEDDLSIEETV